MADKVRLFNQKGWILVSVNYRLTTPGKPGEISGKVSEVLVDEGSPVQAGDVLFKLDDSLLQDQRAIAQLGLETAQLALQQLTSPTALALAQKAVAQDQIDLGDAQKILDNQLHYSENTTAIENARANLTVAQDALDNAQERYDSVPGDPDTNTGKAIAYQTLYATQQKYDKALYMYNTWIIENNQEQVDIKTANLEVIKAKLADDQNLMAYLPGEQVPQMPAGRALSQIRQAELNVRLARANLALLNTQIAKLTVHAPAAGVILTRSIQPGETAAAGAAAISMAQLENLTITVYVPEDRYGVLSLNQSAALTVDSFPGETFDARIIHIADQAEFTPRNVQTVEGRASTVFAVKLEVQDPDGKLKPGMPADVTFANQP